MRIVILKLAVLALLTACGGGEDEESSSRVFKSMGSRQCSGGGASLAALQAELTAANVHARSAACGTNGMAVPTVCGGPDGRIGIFEISASQTAAAAAAGFTPLSTLPAAKTIPCS